MITMDIGTTINLFGSTNMTANRLKSDMPINFMTNLGSKIVDKVGSITGAGQKNPIQR